MPLLSELIEFTLDKRHGADIIVVETETMSKNYYAFHLRRLADEADGRFRELMRVLDTRQAEGESLMQVDSVRVRLAVDDFKVILAEIRRLK